MESLTAESQRLIEVKNFVGNKKVFEEEMENQIVGAQAHIDGLLSDSVSDKKLSDLNFKLGFKAGLQRSLHVVSQLEEELEERRS